MTAHPDTPASTEGVTPADAPEGRVVLVPHYLLDAAYDPDSPVNAQAVALWAYIHQHYTGLPLPSQERLAEETGQSRRTVQRQLDALKAADVFTWGSGSSRTDGYACAIGAPGGSWVKIGRSKTPKRRLAEIQTSAPEKLAVLWMTSGGEALERHLHETFHERRGQGEWFDFAGVDAVALISQAARSFRGNA